ncbi:MAG: 4-hydroxy-4-methyl-2-oxoglutarate aldolase [Solirubrobacteraceae bacterium]|nr:4-hydroxy-4-methyl-2-oxoglutarate aldolase [Solirubrobacteraceae bacterium]
MTDSRPPEFTGLAELGAATVHEAYGRRGALPSAIKPIDRSFRLCGPAFTVLCPPADNLWIHRAVYAARPGDVLVVGVRGGYTEAGYWGEILSQAALARRLGGLVLEGGVRDVDQIAGLGFPVFAANVCLRGTSKEPTGDGRLGEPVRIGEVTVHPGDAVVADADGVVVVEAARIAAVATASRTRREQEQTILDDLRRGATTLELLGLAADSS